MSGTSGPWTVAAFWGICPLCTRQYERGAKITKVRKGWAHLECGFQSEPANPRSKGRRTRSAYRPQPREQLVEHEDGTVEVIRR